MTKLCLFMLLLYHIGKGDMQCNIANCDSCNGSICQRCQRGYVLFSNTCYRCSTEFVSCSSCNGSERCIACVSGKYGQFCEYSCNTCLYGLCDIDSGTCTKDCVAGFYWKDHRDCEPCPTNCKTCDNDVECTSCEIGGYLQTSSSGSVSCASCPSRCLVCTDGDTCTSCRHPNDYWGSTCQNYCLYCSGSCHIINGCSIGCNARYYMKFSSFTNGYECKACPTACSSCTSDTECQKCITNYWGSRCQNRCIGCIGYCSKDRGCFSGCQNGFYGVSYQGGTVCMTCPSNCQTCSDLSTCDTCKTGFNGTVCQYNCGHCLGKVCYSDTGECIFNCRSDQYFGGVVEGCKHCPFGCTLCTSAGHCTRCRLGKWGNICEYNCSENCKNATCAKSSGYCSNECREGFHGRQCSLSCLPSCKSCTNQWYCAACKTGYFSKDNNYKRECTDKYCTRRDAGICTQCSSLQWYPHDSSCCSCSSNCENNTCFSNRTCINCSPGKYGDQCLDTCSSQCRDSLCYRDGSCISCKNDSRYAANCNQHCIDAISNCTRCFGLDAYSVTCTRCSNGMYVENNKCKYCSSQCKSGPLPTCNSTTGSCRYGCNNGYYGDKCDSHCNVTNCLSCPDYPDVCQECKDGFYGETISICNECLANCRHYVHCDKNNGSCTSGCPDGRTGEKCNKSCPSGCIICEQYNSSSCSKCSIGFYGHQCEKTCSQNCKLVDGKQFCNKSNGYCEPDCTFGFWGHACEKKCGAGCNGRVCNRTTGICLNKCTNEYYGDNCRTKCSTHCLSREIYSERNCSYETGECLFGCVSGWFGLNCDRKCREQCNRTTCERNSGVCTLGCIEGYSGSRCSKAIVSADDDSTDVTAIVGAGAGAGFAILVIVVVSLLLWRRRQQRRQTSNTHFPSGLQGDDQQEEGYQNLTLNSLNIASGLGNDIQARTSVSDSNIDVYEGLSPRRLPENMYSTLAARSASNANINSNVDIDTAGYQNTTLCSAATESSDYQELISDFKDNTEYCSVLDE